jgi:hypothetical protein
MNDNNIFNYSDQPTTSTSQSYPPIASQYIGPQQPTGNTPHLLNINPSRSEIFPNILDNVFSTLHAINNYSDRLTTSSYPPVASQYNTPVVNSNSPPHTNDNYSQYINPQQPIGNTPPPLNINPSCSSPQNPIGNISSPLSSSNITAVNFPQSEILSFDIIPGYKIIVIPTSNPSNINTINPPIFSFDIPGFKIIAILNSFQQENSYLNYSSLNR